MTAGLRAAPASATFAGKVPSSLMSRISFAEGTRSVVMSAGPNATVAFRRIEQMRACVYWMKGPVLPLKSMDSFGLKSIVFLGSTLMMKYLRAPRPIMWYSRSFSSSLRSASLPLSSEVFFASSYMLWMRSSASTTVPSRDFILPSGSSTMP